MILRTLTDNENRAGSHSLDSSCRRRPASRGGKGMDTGLRRYDGTESRYRCADHRCTCIFEGGHEGHEVRSLNHPKPSCYYPYYLRGLRKLLDAPKPRGRVSNPPYDSQFFFAPFRSLRPFFFSVAWNHKFIYSGVGTSTFNSAASSVRLVQVPASTSTPCWRL